MVTFQTKNPILGKFCRVLQWNMLAYFMAVWYTLQPFGIFCGHLLYLIVIPYTFPVLVCCAKKNLATLVCTVCTCAHQSIDIYVSTFRCDRNLKQLDKIWYSNFGGQKVR
jgi:hypothetical protein